MEPNRICLGASNARRACSLSHLACLLAVSMLYSAALCAWATELRPGRQPQRIGDQFELKGSIADVRRNATAAEPNALLTMAVKLVDRGDLDEALVWFCVGSIRASFLNSVAPDSNRVQLTGTLVFLTAAILNDYLAKNPKAASATIRRAIAWDEQMDLNMGAFAAQVNPPRSEWPTIKQTSREGWRKVAENLLAAPVPAR